MKGAASGFERRASGLRLRVSGFGEVFQLPAQVRRLVAQGHQPADVGRRAALLFDKAVLDLALFMDFANRAGMSGIQEWLSFYWKSPMTPEGLYPEHDLFIQLMKLKNTLRYTKGDELITHLGAEYYD